MKFVAFIILSFIPTLGLAKPVDMKIIESSAKFALPYTFGTHDGKTGEIKGSLKMDPKTLELASVEVRVPISEIKTGKEKMECHLREALGLDYTKSQFPKKHACSDSNELPSTGPDSVAFPDIVFKLDGSPTLHEGNNEVHGTWTIHGVSKPASLQIALSKGKDNAWVLDGTQAFSLKDYGIVVKPFAIIKVKDNAVASFHMIVAK